MTDSLDVMGSCVDDGEQQHRVGKLPVHPDILIEWDELDLWPDETHDSSADGQQNKHTVHTQY